MPDNPANRTSEVQAEIDRTGDVTLCVICPCYDEADVIGFFYDELKPVLESLNAVRHEILFVDDGSSDSTLDILNELARRDPKVRVCSLSRNFGHQVALAAGLDAAGGDVVIMLDTDLQHPPALIPRMIDRYREGYDVVSAVRRDSGVESLFKRITSKAFYDMLARISRTAVPGGVADFSLISRPVYEALRTMRERHRFVRGMLTWLGFRRAFLEYEVAERRAGTSKYTFRRMVRFALDATFSFSAAPLRLATRIGVGITIGGFAYLGWILVRAFYLKDLVPGWASLIGVVLILGGTQLLFIGLIGEYVARIFEEVKGRPLYTLKQTALSRFEDCCAGDVGAWNAHGDDTR